MTAPHTRITAAALTATATMLALTGCDAISTIEEAATSASTPHPTTPPAAPETGGTDTDTADNPLDNNLRMDHAAAKTALSVIPVKKPANMAGYDREEQFPHWRSAKPNGWNIKEDGCDVRQAALIRDGKNVKVGPDCDILSGTWTDPYTGTVMTNPDDIEIDHIVPLGNAYRSGANAWNKNQGIIYANAPDVAVVSLGSANSAKGDQGPEAWKPPNRKAWCVYSLRWVQAKSKYGLSLTSGAEKKALTMMLNTCEEKSG